MEERKVCHLLRSSAVDRAEMRALGGNAAKSLRISAVRTAPCQLPGKHSVAKIEPLSLSLSLPLFLSPPGI